jgi:hypothetical protein
MKVWADPDQAFRPMPMTAPTKTLAEVLQTVPLEDAEQISEFQGLVYMPEQQCRSEKSQKRRTKSLQGINPYQEA